MFGLDEKDKKNKQLDSKDLHNYFNKLDILAETGFQEIKDIRDSN